MAQAQSAKHVTKTAQRICRVRKSRLSVTIHEASNFKWICLTAFLYPIVQPCPLASGRRDDLLWKISKCAKSTHENHSRNLTGLIYNQGAALDIEMNYVSITCRKKRPRIHDVKVHWPVLSMRSWCHYILTHHPGILLGGHRLSNKSGWEMMLQTFWNRFRDIKPDHCVFSSSKPLARCIPFMTHGDEGVTHRRVPFMVQSWQPVISFLGPNHTAISGSPGFRINSVFTCSVSRV